MALFLVPCDMPSWDAVNPPGPTLFKSRVIRWHSRWELMVVEARNDDDDDNDDNDDDEQTTTAV